MDEHPVCNKTPAKLSKIFKYPKTPHTGAAHLNVESKLFQPIVSAKHTTTATEPANQRLRLSRETHLETKNPGGPMGIEHSDRVDRNRGGR